MSGSFFDNSILNPNQVGFNDFTNPAIAEANNLKAVIFVFKPTANQFGDVALRPFQYRFDENFQSQAQEFTDLSRRGASARHVLDDFVSRNNLSDNMIPAWQPQMKFHSSRLSDKYRFILMLTDTGSNLIGANTVMSSTGPSQLRRIYTGYFEDEPYNPLTFGHGTPTFNPNAIMIFTHKTVLGSDVSHGQFGSRYNTNVKASEAITNTDVVHGYMGHATNADQQVFLMTPSQVVNTIETTSHGYSVAMPGLGALSNRSEREVFSDMFEQPTHHVKQIFRGISRFQDDISTRGRSMTNRVENLFEDEFFQDDMARNNLSRFMDIPRFGRITPLDLDLDSRYSLDTIDKLVGGDLSIKPFDQPRPSMYATVDQERTDSLNMYSSLIGGVVGPVLNAAGLNEMAFIYQIKHSLTGPEDQFLPFSVRSYWSMSEEDKVLAARTVGVELSRGIFKTIFDSMGSFEVQAQVDSTGMTRIKLNLVDQGLYSDADFELPSCLGGLISPLLGDSLSNSHNSEQITGLYGIATGTNTGTQGFNDDDREFLNFAQDFNGQNFLTDSSGGSFSGFDSDNTFRSS